MKKDPKFHTQHFKNSVTKLCTILLEEGELPMLTLAKRMDVTDSGVRGYMRGMMACGVVVTQATDPSRRAVAKTYKITDDHGAIQAYIDGLTVGDPDIERAGNNRLCGAVKLKRDPTRHLHLASDDEMFHAKLATTKIPPRHWLLQALFGDGPARRVGE